MPKKSPKKFKNTKKAKVKSISKLEVKSNVRVKREEKKAEKKSVSNVNIGNSLDFKKTENPIELKAPPVLLKEQTVKDLQPQKRFKVTTKKAVIFLMLIIVIGGILFLLPKVDFNKLILLLKKPSIKLETSSSNRTVIWDEFEKNPENSDNTDSSNNNNNDNNSNNDNNDNNNEEETDNETESPYTSALLLEIKNTLLSIQGEIDILDTESLDQPTTYEF